MNNADIARIFNEFADLLEISGADAFRVNTYRRVVRTIEDQTTELTDLATRGELAKLPGVGQGTANKIHELLDTGRITQHQELLQQVPATLLDVLRVPGLGPKKVALLWRERDITSLDDLRAAINAGQLADLKGFGDKTVQQIAKGLDFLATSGDRRRLATALRIAESLQAIVRDFPGVTRVEHAGSLRRGRETVGDIDLLCIADDAAATIQRFTRIDGVEEVLAAGQTKGSIRYAYRPRRSIQVDLRVVAAEHFGAAWQYFTGSQAHNVRLRERAVRRGWSLSEYGLVEGERLIAGATEPDIYAALDLPCYPPELREDRYEFDLSAVPDDLLTTGDIRGDLHMHTVASDGIHTIEEMAAAARDRGYRFICIADHSASSVIANGLSPERLSDNLRAARRAQEQLSDITIWIGAEVDILADGRLDYDDELLAELDFVVASIHAGMTGSATANTQRTLAAIRHPCVNVIGHPTGRLINTRAAMELDMSAICDAAAETGTALEINASIHRLDLKDTHAHLAQQRGCILSINTDAHATDQLDAMPLGVTTARRGLVRRDSVLNTWSAEKIQEWVQAKRERR